MSEERILCAAVLGMTDGEDPIIFAGYRHSDCIRSCIYSTHCRVNQEEQGFLTSNGRFVNRYEAYQIALKAGQIEDLGKDILTSEDLY